VSRARALGVAALLAIPLGVSSGRAATTPQFVFSADRAPSVSGEIYRLDPSGHRVDLSRSPYQDTNPAVSWDGKRVAFVSDRGGSTAVYTVGIDGRGLKRLGPSLAPLSDAGCTPQLAWQPHGNVLAVAACGNLRGFLWIVRPGRKPLRVMNSKSGIAGLAWSPDGRVVVGSPFSGIARAFSPAGRALWQADGMCCGSWSAQGLLAFPLGHAFGFRVYDETGHARFAASGSLAGNLAWSPAGRLAVIRNHRLEVRTATGALVFGKSISGRHGLVWADEQHVILGGYGSCYCQAKSVEIPSGRVSSASGNWFGNTFSRDGKLVTVTPQAKSGEAFILGVARPAGGAVKTYTHVAGCWGDGVWLPAATSIQFVGASRSLLYQSGNYCDEPFANLYSVSSGGGPAKRLTNAQAQESQPALSSDGSTIAYVWAEFTGLSCKGCSDGIRIVNADGSHGKTLTEPQDCTFDDSPTWSPDSTTILFAEAGCDSSPELFTIPATGGTPHDLKIAGQNPAWGPTQIAYVGSEQADRGLWTANPDGSNSVKVANDGTLPAWSSDGQLAYLVGAGNLTAVVGSTQAKLPFRSVTSLAWSPDGTRFVVTARTTRNGPYDIYTVKTDGTSPVRLTKDYSALGAWRGGAD
jgi:Tol biopolymer transport system component